MRKLIFAFWMFLMLINAFSDNSPCKDKTLSLLLSNDFLNKPKVSKKDHKYFYPQPSYDVYDNMIFRKGFTPPVNILTDKYIFTETIIRHREYLFFKKIFLKNNSSSAKSDAEIAKAIDNCLKICFDEPGAPEIYKILSQCQEIYKQKKYNYIFCMFYTEILILAEKYQDAKIVYDEIENIRKGQSAPGIHQFIKTLIGKKLDKGKSNKNRKQAAEFMAAALTENEFEPEEYNLLLRQIRIINDKSRKNIWNYLYSELMKRKSRAPEWFFNIIAGNYELNNLKKMRRKALGARWKKDYAAEKKYWLKYSGHMNNALSFFKSSWLARPSCPESSLGMMNAGREFSAEIDDPRCNVTTWFNLAVRNQIDFMPAYFSLISTFRSAAWGETRIMKCAETFLKTGLFNTEIPDIYLHALIVAASDYRFAWQGTFHYKRVFENLCYYFENRLKTAKNTEEKNMILARQVQMYRLCARHKEAAEVLKKLPDNYKISDVFKDLYRGYRLAVLKRKRPEVLAEIKAYTGKNGRLLFHADEARKKGLGLMEEKILELSLRTETDNTAKSYLTSRMAMTLAGRDAEYTNTPGELAAFCIREFKFDAFEFMIKHGYDLNKKMTSGRYPLGNFLLKKYSAPYKTQVIKMTNILLKNGARVDSIDKYGNTPLHYAAANSRFPEVSKMLVAAKADINAVNFNKSTPLILACKRNNLQAAEYLARLKDINIEYADSRKFTALIHAILKSKPELVKLLLAHGARIDIKLKHGWSPLGTAVYYNRYENARVLVEAGADLNAGARGASPLIVAVIKNLPECTKLLLNAGADPHKKDKNGKDAFAYVKPNQKEISVLLKKYNKKSSSAK